MALIVRAGPGRRLKTGPPFCSPTWAAATAVLGTLCSTFPGSLNGDWTGSGEAALEPVLLYRCQHSQAVPRHHCVCALKSTDVLISFSYYCSETFLYIINIINAKHFTLYFPECPFLTPGNSNVVCDDLLIKEIWPEVSSVDPEIPGC